MKNIFLGFIILVLFSCSLQKRQYASFSSPKDFSEIHQLPVDSSSGTIIHLDNPLNKIEMKDLIEKALYIPLETRANSLIGYYQKIIIYNNYIYVYDGVAAEGVLIFKMNGRFVSKIGVKGGGPDELSLLRGMSIDRKQNLLILYDNGKRKLMYYTLLGKFVKSVDVKFRFSGKFACLSTGETVAATGKNDENRHLESLNEYRLVYSDSAGDIRKVAFRYDDNEKLYIAWSDLFYSDDELVYHPQFLNSIYSVLSDSVKLRFTFDLSKFSAFENDRISVFDSDDEFDEYRSRCCSVEPEISENKTHLSFSLYDKGKRYYYFYDKRSNKAIGFKNIVWSGSNIVNLPVLSSYREYFISVMPVGLLQDYYDYCCKNGAFISNELKMIIEKSDSEDNSILVLFKLREL